MTTDIQELLTLAAKAVGFDYPHIMKPGGRVWNPLTDDGDLHRLARDLRMVIDLYGGAVFYLTSPTQWMTLWFTPGNREEEALAIIKAAAAIGKEMGE